MKKKIKLFISTCASAEFHNWCNQNSIELNDQSLIAFEPIPYHVTQPFDVIFYSSPRSVEFTQNLNSVNALHACVGEGTAAVLRSSKLSPAFVGKESSDPDSVGREFVQWLNGKRVIFPVSNQAIGSIWRQIPEDQREVVEVYRTVDVPVRIAESDLYVFTSPSNWNSFRKLNEPVGQLISWGKSTSRAIIEDGFSIVEELTSPQWDTLQAYLKSLVE